MAMRGTFGWGEKNGWSVNGLQGSKQVARHHAVSAPLPWWWAWPLGWRLGTAMLWQQSTLFGADVYKLFCALSLACTACCRLPALGLLLSSIKG
jgi:hypothetical protein